MTSTFKTIRVSFEPSSTEEIIALHVEPVSYSEPMQEYQRNRMKSGWVRVTGQRISGSEKSSLLGHFSTRQMILCRTTHEMPKCDFDRGENRNCNF